jgi:hypothetical protein
MPERQNNATWTSALKTFSFVLFSLFVLAVLFILGQLFQRSAGGGGTGDLKLVTCLALICALLPWGVLVAYLVAIRLRPWLLVWRTFLFNAVAWIVALLVFVLAIASTANKEDTGSRALISVFGIVVSLMFFGLFQFVGWLSGIPRGQRGRALKLLLVFPTLLALFVWCVGTFFQSYVNAAFGLWTSTPILIGAPFVSAAILTACILAPYLGRGLKPQDPTSDGQILDQLGTTANTDSDTRH